jgi:hypothetical protein
MKALLAWIEMASKKLLGFFEDSTGKFSSKRLIALGCFITSLILAFKGGWWAALIYLSAAVVLGIISAVTKT